MFWIKLTTYDYVVHDILKDHVYYIFLNFHPNLYVFMLHKLTITFYIRLTAVGE